MPSHPLPTKKIYQLKISALVRDGMTCQFAHACRCLVLVRLYITMAILAQCTFEGLDPFRLRHAGSGIKLASEISPCLSCTSLNKSFRNIPRFQESHFAINFTKLEIYSCIGCPSFKGNVQRVWNIISVFDDSLI